MKKLGFALMLGTALVPVGVCAQEVPSSAGDSVPGKLDDIIVTAQRFEQRLQDVPLSVSAVGAKELEARRATSLADLQYSVPGLSSYEYGLGKQLIQLRGVSNTLGSSTIGIYFDETPLGLDT